MINHLMGFIKPNSTRSAIASSLLSMAVSKLAAKTTALTVLVSGLMYLPQNQAANTLAQFLLSFNEAPKPVVKIHKPIKVVRLAKAAPVSDQPVSKELQMHTFEKQYTCVFTGKVTCGGQPCRTAAIQLNIATRQNPHIVRTVETQPDGSYEVSVLLKEYLNEHVDWWIVADSPDSASKQLQGREILMEDSTLKIDEPVSLL